VISRSAAGRLGPLRTIPGAQEVLDEAFVGGSLELLTGSSPKGYTCCSSVKLVSSRGGSFAAAKTLVRGLTGATVGRLLSMPGNLMLASAASAGGVWGGSSTAAGRPPALHRLSPSGTGPQALGAAALQGGRSVVAWSPASPAGSIYVAVGPKLRKGVTAFALPAGHPVDQLAVAPASGNATVAWIESWVDRRGSFHSQAAAADLAGGVRRFAGAGALASELSFAGNSHGDQLLVWKACHHSGACTVRGVPRSGSGHFGRTLSFGRLDASQAPSAAVASDGAVLVGWIDHGHVIAANRQPGAASFDAPHVVSSTTFAADLTVAFGPKRVAMAVWTQGTYAQSVMGAVYR